MKNLVESDISGAVSVKGESEVGSWVKVSAVAAASALAGGLAAAWFYRKTLTRLQHAEFALSDSNFGISEASDEEQSCFK